MLLFSENKVIKIIESLDTIVTTEYIKPIFNYLARMTEARRWSLVDTLFEIRVRLCNLKHLYIWSGLLALNCSPKILIHFELVKIRTRVACTPAKQKYRVSVS
jgi:hypothetical protein